MKVPMSFRPRTMDLLSLYATAIAPDAPPAAPAVPPVGGGAPPAPAAPPAAPTAAAPPAAAPITYESLKLPENSGLEPAVVERTTAIASELKLSPDHAQKVLGLVAQEVATHAKLAVEADLKSRLPGGKVWEEQNAKWKGDALAHPELGAGKPDQLDGNVSLAKRVLAKFGGTDAPALEKFLTDSGLASHPATLGLLVRIGKAMREDQLVVPNAGSPGAPKRIEDMLYPKKDGAA